MIIELLFSLYGSIVLSAVITSKWIPEEIEKGAFIIGCG